MALLNRPRGRRWRGVTVALFMAVATLAPRPGLGGSPPPVTPTQVYAAFTLNLTRFVTWPKDAFADLKSPLIIGTFPHDPINDDLDAAVRDETLGLRPIRTMRIRSLDDVARCHVIFMSRSIPGQTAVLERCARRPILTIGDGEEFLTLGGHVRFVPQPPNTRLRLSPENLKTSRLECRAQLLRIAAVP